MSTYIEKPFEYLRRKDGTEYSDSTIKNWYIARAYVLEKLKTIAFKPNDDARLHVIVDGDNGLMLSVVRQLALSAHYINYDEDNEREEKRRRTLITLVSPSPMIEDELKKEEYLSNLMVLCRYSIDGEIHNSDSYIDVELEIVNSCPTRSHDTPNEIIIDEADVEAFMDMTSEDELYTIDTRKAQYAGRMYELGKLIENLPSENIHDAHRYILALNLFQYEKLQNPLKKLVDDEKWKNLTKVKNELSNIFCADCFESRARSIELCQKKDTKNYSDLWEKNNESLCISEHARWVVEKLIMGFRPLSMEERVEDERLAPYKKKRKQFRDNLKGTSTDPSHIDLCSYRDLRRINPDDMKYDSFLMLAIPKILERINHEDE